MKKILLTIIISVIILNLFSGCEAEKPKKKGADYHTLYIRDEFKSEEVIATFFNSKNNKSENVKMDKISEDKKSFTFSCEGNTSTYNMAYVTIDGSKSARFAFNKCVSGWNNSEEGFMPYVQGEKISYKYKHEDITLKFNGYDKKIHIWKPDGYSASSKEKYSTIYMLDGIGADFLEPPVGHTIAESDNSTAQVKSMMKTTGKKAIIVAVETDGDGENCWRDDELVPNLGKMAHEEGTSKKYGSKFSNFMSDTLVPYIEKHYNVYTDASHNSVEGSSLGGLEAFYIVMDHPEKFGTAGALSPSFWYYNKTQWKKFLSKNKFGKDSPFIYIYSGGIKGDTGREATEMVNLLNEMKYPKEKLAFHYFEKGTHSIDCWRGVFAEFLEAMVHRQVKPLQ